MQRRLVPGKGCGRIGIGDPAAIAQTRTPHGCDSVVRIANAVDGAVEAKRPGRLNKELSDLRRPLVVAPIADPDQVVLALDLGQGAE